MDIFRSVLIALLVAAGVPFHAAPLNAEERQMVQRVARDRNFMDWERASRRDHRWLLVNSPGSRGVLVVILEWSCAGSGCVAARMRDTCNN